MQLNLTYIFLHEFPMNSFPYWNWAFSFRTIVYVWLIGVEMLRLLCKWQANLLSWAYNREFMKRWTTSTCMESNKMRLKLYDNGNNRFYMKSPANGKGYRLNWRVQMLHFFSIRIARGNTFGINLKLLFNVISNENGNTNISIGKAILREKHSRNRRFTSQPTHIYQ